MMKNLPKNNSIVIIYCINIKKEMKQPVILAKNRINRSKFIKQPFRRMLKVNLAIRAAKVAKDQYKICYRRS